ncbi:putative O-succinylbenzoate--CoA ligase [Gordonia polyisoprenivorans NBRC 16320 = JCM 10675]|uniref:Acyl--CoA ligase n=1 Tax=Gordonia polyisoprenivorans TaxID=84595 RepID=A0A846WQN9_9ACTN|nr:class I adenylate-forming enzyme family protein [Gordonia polyisoprenivorans]NKY03924.1 acyl--CoA ligase [Gordonia polyisoprenivorans]GAB24236.1 putative O-succinylbenzoate--CoA ligase [Gordonia polyisoprenivorans NBRC 16320 = JCM 10675]
MNHKHHDDRPRPFTTLPEALQHWSVETPDALALTAGGTELTYADLYDHVARCVGWLTDRGVVRGDRVVIVGFNRIEWVVHYLATLSMGAVIAPANNRLNPSQFADQVALLDASLVLTDELHRDIASEVQSAKVRPMDQTYLNNDAGSFPALDADALALISFTSGTTGKPKGAMLTQSALAQASWPFAQVMGTGGGDSTLVVVPMFHNTGFVDQFGHMLLLGGRTDLLHKFRTKDAVAALTERPVTYLAAVPSIHRLIMLADGADEALSSVRTLLYGGSPMPAPWIDELLAKWPRMKLFHGYGMTEYGSAVSFLPSEFATERGESVGFAVPGTSIRIVDDTGSDVTEGETGEMWVRGPTRMQGYWRQPDLSADKIREGWLRTGDLARCDAGFYYIEGRVDDVINRGGEKILPAHVESMLSELEPVADSCVFGVPDSVLQNRVWAAVEERQGHVLDEAAARKALLSKLPDYAVPERICVLQSLSRGASGKVDRRATARHFAELIEKGELSVRR